MGTKLKPGKHDAYGKARPDEPMFVLLARDEQAPKRILGWAHRRLDDIAEGRRDIGDFDKIREAIECARSMGEWYRKEQDRLRQRGANSNGCSLAKCVARGYCAFPMDCIRLGGFQDGKVLDPYKHPSTDNQEKES